MLITANNSIAGIAMQQRALMALLPLHLTAYLYPDSIDEMDGALYDYIVVGGGTAGCVVADRLSDNPNNTILIIEAGDDPPLESNTPSLMLYLKGSSASWQFKSQDDLVALRPSTDELSLGKVLGGTSSVSYLYYLIGNHYDYNGWAKIVNDNSWSFENVLPYFKKSQKLNDDIIENSPDSENFGTDGPIGLTVYRTSESESYLRGFLQAGNKHITSFNGNNSIGYTYAMFTIADNLRQSTVNSYISQTNKTNLFIMKNTFVKRIIFDACKRAVGVIALTSDNRHVLIRNKREVIVSAGSINTPKLLMLSGIGEKNQLDKFKIETISELPVGKNLQSNLLTSIVFNFTATVQPYKPADPNEYPAAVIMGSISLSNNIDAYPDCFIVNYINNPEQLMDFCTFTYRYNNTICNSLIETSMNSKMLYTTISVQRSKFRGKVLLRSHDPLEQPLIYNNYLGNENDSEILAKCLLKYVEVGNTDDFKSLGAELKYPDLPDCSDIDKGTLGYWRCYVKYMITSGYQHCGSCAMGTVVEPDLKLKGVRSVRVVDSSIFPTMTAGGTLAATVMVAEKAADMIKEDNKGRICCTE